MQPKKNLIKFNPNKTSISGQRTGQGCDQRCVDGLLLWRGRSARAGPVRFHQTENKTRSLNRNSTHERFIVSTRRAALFSSISIWTFIGNCIVNGTFPRSASVIWIMTCSNTWWTAVMKSRSAIRWRSLSTSLRQFMMQPANNGQPRVLRIFSPSCPIQNCWSRG